MKRKRKRLWSILLIMMMIITQAPISAMGKNEVPIDGSIVSFAALDQDTVTQTVPLGTKLSELDLPETLEAKICRIDEEIVDMDEELFDDDDELSTSSNAKKETDDQSDADVIMVWNTVDVEWNSSPEFDGDQAGEYVFTADTGEYISTDDAAPPQIYITVQDEELEQLANEFNGIQLLSINDRFVAQGLKFKEISSDEVQVIGYDQVLPSGFFEIPSEVADGDGTVYTVVSIGNSAFSGCSGITEVVIPDSIESIGSNAFNACKKLEAVTFSENTVTIGNFAFSRCISLKNVDIPDSVTSIGKNAFNDCSSLEHIILPSNIHTLENSIFSGCTKLKSVTLPDQLTHINEAAFERCSNLELTELPVGVTDIGSRAFQSCKSIYSIVLPEGLISIGANVFYECENLETVSVPGSVKKIGSYAFYKCSPDLTVTVPVADIGTLVIESGLDSSNILVSDGGNIPVMGSGVFGDYSYQVLKDKNVQITGWSGSDDDLTIPSEFTEGGVTYNVTSIGDYAFLGNSTLRSVTISHGITAIGEAAFSSCPNLTDIMIPSSVNSIGSSAFSSCSNLEKAGLSEGLANIGDSAFAYCNSLKAVTIPSSTVNIGSAAFSVCQNLTDIKILDGVLNIGEQAFSYCSTLEEIIIPDSVESLGGNAFFGCKKLQSVHVGKGIKKIGEKCFPTPFDYSKITTNSPHVQLLLIYSQNISGIPACTWDGGEDVPDGAIVTVDGQISIDRDIKIDKGASVTITDGAALINNSNLVIDDTVENYGLIENHGLITGSGSIANYGKIYDYSNGIHITVTGNPVKMAAEVRILILDSTGRETNTAVYGDTIAIQAVINPPSLLSNQAGKELVDFMAGDLVLDGIEVINGAASPEPIVLTGNSWIPGSYTITAEYRGGDDLLPNHAESVTLTVEKKSRTIQLDGWENISTSGITMKKAQPSMGKEDGVIEYGYAEEDSAASVKFWQMSPNFTGLSEDTSYYFFARIGEGVFYKSAVSDGLLGRTGKTEPVPKNDSGDSSSDNDSEAITYPILTGDVPASEGSGLWEEYNSGVWKLKKDSTGNYAKKEWLKINGTWYLFNDNAIMLKGWVCVNGTWYYFDASGAMKTGWQLIQGFWYYLKPDGAMATGWVNTDGVWYFLKEDGSWNSK